MESLVGNCQVCYITIVSLGKRHIHTPLRHYSFLYYLVLLPSVEYFKLQQSMILPYTYERLWYMDMVWPFSKDR